MADMAVGPIFPIAGNDVRMTAKGKVQITNADGKVKTLSQDEFKKQLTKNFDKIAAGEDVEFKSSKKGLIAGAVAAATVIGTLAGLAIAVKKKVIKPAKIAEKDVLLQKAGKKINNFALVLGQKTFLYAAKAYRAAAKFVEKYSPKAKAAAEKV